MKPDQAPGYDAILLASYGGPSGQEEVIPFLQRATAGRGVPPERLEEVALHYRALGGVSPINAQNRALIAALTAELATRGITLPILLGNRNSAPFFADVLQEFYESGARRVLALATSVYSSYSSCRQYREDLAAGLAAAGLAGKLDVVKVRPYFDRAGFVAANARQLIRALAEVDDFGNSVVMFSTHSIPHAMAMTAGPHPNPDPAANRYTAQHLEVAKRCIAEVTRVLGGRTPTWRLVYQSRSGPARVPWLEPDVNDALRQEAAAGTQRVIVAPIGFISDHVEVIWDLDTEARATAMQLGIELTRIPTVGTHPLFVSGLADLLAAHLASSVDQPGEAWQGYCSDSCCLAPARPGRSAATPLPTVPGASA